MKRGKMTQKDNCRISESAVSEIVGALILISMIVLVVAVIATGIISSPLPKKVPQVRFSVANSTTLVNGVIQYSVSITHEGGDEIPDGEYAVFINDNKTTNITISSADNKWSIGKTIIANLDVAPKDVRVYYTGSNSPAQLGERTVGDTTSPLTPPTTIIPTPTPCIPTALFTYYPLNPDTSTQIFFTDMSTCEPTSWSWTSSDGWSATTKNPAHTFSTAGTYIITLTSSNTYGTSLPYSLPITVTSYIPPPHPVATFTANITIGCVPLNVLFNDTSTQSPTSWNWTFGDGGTSTLQNPSHTYLTNGVYTVSLTATNSGGSDTKTQVAYITVGPAIANFTASPTTGCLPMTVQFMDVSTGNHTSWYWDFGDGTNSTLQNPSHPYTTAGVYSIRLSVSNTCGDSPFFIRTNYINVGQVPVANFTANPNTGCLPMTVQFTDSSTNQPTLWNWSFGDGTFSNLPNPVNTYSVAGTYTVSLNASNSCGSNQSVRTAYITIGQVPVANFTANKTTGCLPMTVKFTDSSSGTPANWTWSFGDGNISTQQNPVNTYSVAGTYTVSLNASNSCGSNQSVRNSYITINTTPVANFMANQTIGCQPMTIQFTDSSKNLPTLWNWTFDDGNTSTLQNPQKTYAAAGNFTVSLISSNTCGNSSQFTSNITVGTPVTSANFTADTRSGCIPYTVQFSGNATGTVKAWLWDFGDGGFSADQNPTHQYQTTGDFTVNLTVFDYCGGHNTSIISNYIHAATTTSPPISKAGGFWTLGEGTGTTILDSSGHGNIGTIITGSWANCPAQGRGYLIFDGNSSAVTVQNSPSLSPTQQITMEAWVYPVQQQSTNFLQKQDWNGHTLSQDIWMGWQGGVTLANGSKIKINWAPGTGHDQPTLNTWYYVVLTYDGTALRLYVNGTERKNTPLTGNLSIISSPVYIGNKTSSPPDYFNGSIANVAISSYALAPCEILARYQAFTPQGCLPGVNFTANKTSGCLPMTVQFTDLTTGSPSSWAWNFGDNNTSTTQHPVKTYNNPGIYNVTLTASNIFGTNQSTLTGFITVGQVPVANFTTNQTSGCLPMTVKFTDSSSGTPTGWNWSFGDGNTSSLQNPVKTYYSAGIYSVSLTAGNIPCGNGTPFTRNGYITVSQLPVANFSANKTTDCLPMTILFTDLSSGTPTNWNWSFGDGNTSSLQNPVKTYYSAGIYSVSLSAGNSPCGNGTPFTRNGFITVTQLPVANFSASNISGPVPLTVQFTDTSTGLPTNWNWSFGDGTNSVSRNPSHTYIARGNYSVKLNASNACGSGIVTKNDYIQVTKKSFVDFIIDENVFVYGDTLELQGNTASGPGATVVITGPLSTSDLNGGASVDVTTIYIDGKVTLDGGSASLGSAGNPGDIYVNGDLYLGKGSRDIYGDVYVAGNFYLKDAHINGIVYVNGDLTLDWTPTLAPDSRIYYTGTFSHPGSMSPDILSKCIHQTTVPGFEMPGQMIPPTKSPSWYATRGYVSSGALTSNLKIFADSYSSTSYRPSAYNVTIIARNGDIKLTNLGGSGVTGVLFAPYGKVTFDGGFFEGVVIARDGFFVTSGGVDVTFRNFAYYFANPDDYPF